MTDLLIALWLLSGYAAFIWGCWRISGKILLGDLLVGILASLGGPVLVPMWFLFNSDSQWMTKVIYQRKRKL